VKVPWALEGFPLFLKIRGLFVHCSAGTAPFENSFGALKFEAVSGPCGPLLRLAAGAEVKRQLHADFQFFLRYILYHAGDFESAFEFDNANCVGREVLELRGRHVDYCVCEEFAFARNLNPAELLRVADIAEGARGQMGFSAFLAFASHQFALV